MSGSAHLRGREFFSTSRAEQGGDDSRSKALPNSSGAGSVAGAAAGCFHYFGGASFLGDAGELLLQELVKVLIERTTSALQASSKRRSGETASLRHGELTGDNFFSGLTSSERCTSRATRFEGCGLSESTSANASSSGGSGDAASDSSSSATGGNHATTGEASGGGG